MPSPSPIALVLGAGPNVGQSVGKAFAAKGYRIALVSRKASDSQDTPDQIHIKADFSDPNSIVDVFSKVKHVLGIPSVVVYNVAAGTPNPPNDPLSRNLADFTKDLIINTTSPFVAAQQAVLNFAELPDSAAKTFIYTGNILNTTIIPALLDAGVGKSASAHFIHSAAEAYKDRGFKFYYCDERLADGKPVYSAVNGEAHAKHYLELAEGKTQGPWLQTFVKDTGYKKF
ncbi:short-chain dehydrogenase [Phlyctema vagabunda]|uniref:Short-chain dehydrogenase n=1 Tax=Phlyctema vagabunda TaxID=108571 RepID=A0ABR4PG66_9HELO